MSEHGELEQAVFAVTGGAYLRDLERAHAGAYPADVLADAIAGGWLERVDDAEHEQADRPRPHLDPIPYDWERQGL